MKRDLYVFRNCFTGAIAGGDIHNSQLITWILKNKPDVKVHLIHPEGDEQSNYYNDVRHIHEITYKQRAYFQNFAWVFVVRALQAAFIRKFPLALHGVFVASSHFLPDVLPTLVHGKGMVRAVYIHHIVQDMKRPRNVNTVLANIQEKLCLIIIRHKFDKIIVVNSQVKTRLVQLGLKAERILISSNAVDSNIFTNSNKNIHKRKIDLCFMGRMVPQKGINDFLDVVDLISKSIPNIKTTMMGTGPGLETIRTNVSDRGLPISVPGFVNDSVKVSTYQSSKLFVFPSYEEGWGIALAEALGCGAIGIAYDLPVYGEIFGDTLITTPLGDTHALASKAIELLKLFAADQGTHMRLQERAISRISTYSTDLVSRNEYAFLVAQK